MFPVKRGQVKMVRRQKYIMVEMGKLFTPNFLLFFYRPLIVSGEMFEETSTLISVANTGF